jgi:hypothetical protein
LPGPTDDYLAYKRWFEAEHDELTIPVDCIELDPVLSYSNQYTWDLRWFLVFTNPISHIRIKENFAKIAGLQKSRRISFAYHYGPTVRTDSDGTPEGEPSDPVFVRIDNAGRPAHLHHEGKPEDHIPQERVSGLILEEVDLFEFIEAAIRHRTSGRSIARELGYKIRSK